MSKRSKTKKLSCKQRERKMKENMLSSSRHSNYRDKSKKIKRRLRTKKTREKLKSRKSITSRIS